MSAEERDENENPGKFRISSVLDQINPLSAASAIVAATVVYMQFTGLREDMESMHNDSQNIRDKIVSIDGRTNQIAASVESSAKQLELRFQIIDEKMRSSSANTDQKIANLHDQLERMREEIKRRSENDK